MAGRAASRAQGGLALSGGRLFVSDIASGRVRVITPGVDAQSTTVATLAGSGRALVSGGHERADDVEAVARAQGHAGHGCFASQNLYQYVARGLTLRRLAEGSEVRDALADRGSACTTSADERWNPTAKSVHVEGSSRTGHAPGA